MARIGTRFARLIREGPGRVNATRWTGASSFRTLHKGSQGGEIGLLGPQVSRSRVYSADVRDPAVRRPTAQPDPPAAAADCGRSARRSGLSRGRARRHLARGAGPPPHGDRRLRARAPGSGRARLYRALYRRRRSVAAGGGVSHGGRRLPVRPCGRCLGGGGRGDCGGDGHLSGGAHRARRAVAAAGGPARGAARARLPRRRLQLSAVPAAGAGLSVLLG